MDKESSNPQVFVRGNVASHIRGANGMVLVIKTEVALGGSRHGHSGEGVGTLCT